MEPQITVAVVTHDSARLIPEFVAALPAASVGTRVRIVVADNASADGTTDAVRSLAPTATVVEIGANLGYAAGINAALAVSADADAVVVANPDIRLGPGSLARLYAALQGDVGIAAPRLREVDGVLIRSLRRDATVRRALGEAFLGGRRAGRRVRLGNVVTDPAAYDSPRAVDWASGAVLMCSRACIDATGPWDETFFLYSEESEYQQRARAHGFTVRYVPDATAMHLGGEQGTSPALWALSMRNKVRLFARSHGRARTLAYRGALVCNELIRCGGPTHRAGLRALFGGQVRVAGEHR